MSAKETQMVERRFRRSHGGRIVTIRLPNRRVSVTKCANGKFVLAFKKLVRSEASEPYVEVTRVGISGEAANALALCLKHFIPHPKHPKSPTTNCEWIGEEAAKKVMAAFAFASMEGIG